MSLLANLDTPPPTRQSGLSEEAFEELRTFIFEQTGIHFRDNKRYLLESQVGRRLKTLGVPSFDDYLQLLRNGRQPSELPQLVNAITINETFFLRHPKQYEALVQELIPQLIEHQTEIQRIRLWSAACSTGDEPYTLAILIREHLQSRYSHVQFDIVGTDINTDVLDTARKGVYGSYAVRNVPPELLRRYFTAQDDRYALNHEIRHMVQFKHLNLTDSRAVRSMRSFDIVLCANVLIYFKDDIKRQVTSDLYKSLNPGGYLFVGTSETLHGVTRAFQPVRLNNTIAYQKGD